MPWWLDGLSHLVVAVLVVGGVVVLGMTGAVAPMVTQSILITGAGTVVALTVSDALTSWRRGG